MAVVSSAPAREDIAFPADRFDFEQDDAVSTMQETQPVSYQASDRYLSLQGRLRSVWSVMASSFRLGMVELKTENDLSVIMKALRPLNDRQLRILGFDLREDLTEEVRELIEVQEAIRRERETFEDRSLGAVRPALGHAA